LRILRDIYGISKKDKQLDIYLDICVGYKGISWDIIGLLSWILIRICLLDIIEDKYGYVKIQWDIILGYLFWDTISNHILIIKRYPNISYHILSYPFISFHILKYPRGRTPRW
jgi:hypothetical protein